jgi:hypothetical protein
MIGMPRAMVKFMIVHQATPNWSATRDTAASCCPTWSKAQARARSVRHARGAIAGCTSVQVLTGHAACGQHQIRLCQQITTGRPAIGRSRTHVGRRSLARATAPHSGQPTRSAVVSTSNSSSPPASAATSRRKPSSPNNAAVTDAVASPLTWGLLHGCDRLVVITDREGPRPLNHSFQPGVSPGSPHPLPALLRRTSKPLDRARPPDGLHVHPQLHHGGLARPGGLT